MIIELAALCKTQHPSDVHATSRDCDGNVWSVFWDSSDNEEPRTLTIFCDAEFYIDEGNHHLDGNANVLNVLAAIGSENERCRSHVSGHRPRDLDRPNAHLFLEAQGITTHAGVVDFLTDDRSHGDDFVAQAAQIEGEIAASNESDRPPLIDFVAAILARGRRLQTTASGFVVTTCHDGTDWCVVNANGDDDADTIHSTLDAAIKIGNDLVIEANADLPKGFSPCKFWDFTDETEGNE